MRISSLSLAGACAVAVLLAATTTSAQTVIEGIVHQGSVQQNGIQWRSRIVFDPASVPNGPVRMTLASPLDPKLLTYPEAAVAPVLTGDHVTALVLHPSCGWEPGQAGAPAPSTSTPPTACTTDIHVVQLIETCRGETQLMPPLLQGVAMQIVDVWGPEELMFNPDPKMGLEKRISAFTPAGVDKDLPRRWDDRLGFRRRGHGQKPLYFQSVDNLAEGIQGELTSERDRMRRGAIVAGIAFFAIVTALIVALLRLSRVARVERAERELQVNLRRSAELLDDSPEMVNNASPSTSFPVV